MSLLYRQRPIAGSSSFVFNTNAAAPLRLRVVEPFQSSPNLASVVFTRGQDSVSGVVECAGEKLIVVTGEDLSTKPVVGRVVEMPKSRGFVFK